MGRIIESSPPPKILTSVSHDGLHTLEFNEGTHRYKLNGERVPGATTIGGVYPKGEGLIRWMIEQGIKEYEDKTAMQKGGDVGSVLHDYAERYELGKHGFDWHAVETSPFEKDIRRVIALFIEWRQGNKDTVLMMEELCASPTLKVGGRIDTLREREGLGLVLSDYKTSKSIYISHLIQVIGGYRRMLREWYDMDVPYVEIVKFPKQEDQAMETLLCDANGWVRTVSGIAAPRVEVPNLFQRVEDQFERNMGTYMFQKDIENVLTPPYKKAI